LARVRVTCRPTLVFEKAIEDEQIQNERAKLRAYAQAPSGYYRAWRERMIEQKSDKRDGTIRELECALYLDPGNQQLRKKNDRLVDSRSSPRKT
jgi:hypothetical protein